MPSTEANRATPISFGHFSRAWNEYETAALEWAREIGAARACDVGGGRQPSLSLERLGGVECDVLDISAEELERTPAGYGRLHADICGDLPRDLEGRYDLVVSKMVAEHVRDAGIFHANCRRLLRPGGVACHLFPTLWCFPFVVNRCLPAGMSDRLLDRVAPRNREREEKFPAYYRKCRGPSHRRVAELEREGWEVLDYRGYFGHQYYRRVPIVSRMLDAVTRRLVAQPIAAMTSYACLAMRRVD